MSVCQSLARTSIMVTLLVSTSQCIPTRRPSPTCLQSQPLPKEAAGPKQDVIGGYLVFEKHLEPGSANKIIGRFPSIFHVEKRNEKFHVTATAPRAEFNIYNIKHAFALILFADGSQATIPLENKEMQVVPALQSSLETISFDANSTSETVRNQGQRDQQDLLKTFARDFFGSKNLSTLSLQNLFNAVSQEKKHAFKESSKLQMLSFAPDYSQEAIGLAFNQTPPLGAAALISSSSKINSTLQKLADLSQSLDNKPILPQTDLDYIARLHQYLDRLDQLEINMRSLSFYRKLSLCNANAGSAICRQRSKLTSLHQEFFGFMDEKCEFLSLEDFKASLKESSARNVRSCDSGALLYSVPFQLKNEEEVSLEAIESSLQNELIVLHDKIQEVRRALANVVKTNPDFLQLRTVVAVSEPGKYRISDDKSYFGGVTIQQSSLNQEIDLKKLSVDTTNGLTFDVQFALRIQDITKCSMAGAAIMLGGLPIDLARGGCLRIFNSNATEDAGQIADNSQGTEVEKVIDKDQDPNVDASEEESDATNEDSNQTEISAEDLKSEAAGLPVILIPVRVNPTDEEREQEREAVNQLGSGLERESQPVHEIKISRSDNVGC